MGDRGRKTILAATSAVFLSCIILIAPFLFSGCGGGITQAESISAVQNRTTSFLDACGNLETDDVRSFLSTQYLESNQVPDPITREELVAALGNVNSYRLVPNSDISVEGDQAVVSVTMDIQGKGEGGQTIVLSRQDGEWMVDGFTAMDWTSKPFIPASEQVEVEQALRDFITACIDKDTSYIFKHLSDAYLKKHKLEKAWTSTEFSGIFGTARSYDFDAENIVINNGTAKTDVTIEFGSRGNLEPETAQVVLVKSGSKWLVDGFPFFIY
jgi:hypothetical protein